MLGLTRDAISAIRTIGEREPAGGVRIHAGTRRFARDGAPSILFEIASHPDVEDAVLEIEGARIFLDAESLRALDDKVLDADLSGEEPRFEVYVVPERAQIGMR